MKINTNSIGNYSLQQLQRNSDRKSVLAEGEDLNEKEKEFFVNRYPQNKEEIVDYHFYQKSGQMSGVKVGHLFDKKG
jgi:hypothetical protein